MSTWLSLLPFRIHNSRAAAAASLQARLPCTRHRSLGAWTGVQVAHSQAKEVANHTVGCMKCHLAQARALTAAAPKPCKFRREQGSRTRLGPSMESTHTVSLSSLSSCCPSAMWLFPDLPESEPTCPKALSSVHSQGTALTPSHPQAPSVQLSRKPGKRLCPGTLRLRVAHPD